MILPGLTFVVTPQLSLMVDQLRKAESSLHFCRVVLASSQVKLYIFLLLVILILILISVLHYFFRRDELALKTVCRGYNCIYMSPVFGIPM